MAARVFNELSRLTLVALRAEKVRKKGMAARVFSECFRPQHETKSTLSLRRPTWGSINFFNLTLAAHCQSPICFSGLDVSKSCLDDNSCVAMGYLDIKF